MSSLVSSSVTTNTDIDTAMECPICSDAIVRQELGQKVIAVAGKCFHSTCSSCLENWRKTCKQKKLPLSCPICREEIKQIKPNVALNDLCEALESARGTTLSTAQKHAGNSADLQDLKQFAVAQSAKLIDELQKRVAQAQDTVADRLYGFKEARKYFHDKQRSLRHAKRDKSRRRKKNIAHAAKKALRAQSNFRAHKRRLGSAMLRLQTDMFKLQAEEERFTTLRATHIA